MNFVFSIYIRAILGSLLLVVISDPVYAQKEANIWHFGNGQSLDFNSGVAVQTTGSAMSTSEGSTSYCDAVGNLLFYSNGGGRVPASGQDPGRIWNKNNAVMYDMQGLQGGGFSAIQSSVIIPAPGEPNVYYLFTVDEVEHYVDATPAILAAQPNGRGFRYFKVDLSLNGGLGAVVEADVLLYDYSFEGLCAIRHANQTDYWILMNYDTTGIGVYRVTPSGVSLSAVYPGPTNAAIKSTPNNQVSGAACCNKVMSGGSLFDFDISTGVLSNSINLGVNFGCYEFSHNSYYLYAAELDPSNGSQRLIRYDLLNSFQTGQPIQSTLEVIAPVFSANYMQLAPDGKIYFTDYGGIQTNLGTISCPNSPVPSVNSNVFSYNDLFFSLPNFPSWIFHNNFEDYMDLGPDTLYICSGDTIVLNAGPGTSWSWGGQSVTGIPVVNFDQFLDVTEPGVYSCTVLGECNSGASDQVVVLPGDSAAGFISYSVDSCSQVDIPFLLSVNVPVTSILWNFDDPASGSDNTSSALNPNHTFSSPGTYEVTAILNLPCSTDTLFASVTVGQSSLLTLTFAACSSYTAPWGVVYTQSGTYSDTLTTVNGCDSIVSVNLTISGSVIAPPLASTACSSYTAPWGVVYTQSGTYSDTLATVNGCDSIVTVDLTITGLPTSAVATTPESCGDADGTATVTVLGGSGGYNYVWSNGSSGATVGGLGTGIYTVTVTDQSGCSTLAQAVVTGTSAPLVSVNSGFIFIAEGDSVQLNASGAETYQWTPSSGLSCTDCASPVASPVETTTYFVTGTDSNGCSRTTSVTIRVDIRCNEVFVPNIFSPDGTGPEVNNQLCVYGKCIEEMEFSIYDRWGRIIFETKDPAACWDGRFKGQELTGGTFAYTLIVRQTNGISLSKSGNITLVR